MRMSTWMHIDAHIHTDAAIPVPVKAHHAPARTHVHSTCAHITSTSAHARTEARRCVLEDGKMRRRDDSPRHRGRPPRYICTCARAYIYTHTETHRNTPRVPGGVHLDAYAHVPEHGLSCTQHLGASLALLTIPRAPLTSYSLFPIPYSLIPTPYSRHPNTQYPLLLSTPLLPTTTHYLPTTTTGAVTGGATGVQQGLRQGVQKGQPRTYKCFSDKNYA